MPLVHPAFLLFLAAPKGLHVSFVRVSQLISTAHLDPLVSFGYVPRCWLTRSSAPTNTTRYHAKAWYRVDQHHHHQPSVFSLQVLQGLQFINSSPVYLNATTGHTAVVGPFSLLLIEAGGGDLNKSSSAVPACGEDWSLESNRAAFNQRVLEHEVRLWGQDTKGRH